MLFKNLLVYRLHSGEALDAAALETALSASTLQPCGTFEMKSTGWVAPRGDDAYLRAVERQWLIAHGTNERLLPGAVVNQEVAERAEAMAARQGRPVGRKQLREIKERALEALMPKALTRRRKMLLWIDPADGWLIVDTASAKKADEALEALARTAPGIKARRVDTAHSPGAAMTRWLDVGEIPGEFTIDRDLELCASDDYRATVRYVRHALEGKDIREHIKAGKTATRLGMTWKDRISFVLTETLQLKRVVFLEVRGNEEARDAEGDANERFDADFAMMAGEFAQLLRDLTAALGGEKAPAS
jgi:recombination associated protein RdgC